MSRTNEPKRNRPELATTVSSYTFSILVQVAKDQGLAKLGPTLDYIVADWIGLKRVAVPAEQEQPA